MCLCMLIAQGVLKMRQGTSRPNFGGEDTCRDWNKEGEQGCRELAGAARGLLQYRQAPDPSLRDPIK